MSRHFARPVVEVSAEVFAVLSAADGSKSLSALLTGAGVIEGEMRRAVIEQMRELWSQRVVRLTPAAAGA